jgi:hypothetical protein
MKYKIQTLDLYEEASWKNQSISICVFLSVGVFH